MQRLAISGNYKFKARLRLGVFRPVGIWIHDQRTRPSNFYISGNIVDKSLPLLYGIIMKLDYDSASALLSQLGNPTRLRIVRELVRAGKTGMAVGEIKKRLGTPNSTLSHHLNHLKNVGLVKQQRESTVLRCFVDYKAIDAIVTFLTEECCVAEIDKQR